MRQVIDQLDSDAPELGWKPFSLRQVNFPDQSKRVWARDTAEKPGKGHRAFRLCIAAGDRWGDAGIGRMYQLLGEARFDRQADLEDEAVLIELAGQAGFTPDEARSVMYDQVLDDRLGASHDEAVAQGIFGVPTLLFDGAHPLFVAMRPPPPEDEAVDVFHQVVRFGRDQPYFRELKRPKPLAKG